MPTDSELWFMWRKAKDICFEYCPEEDAEVRRNCGSNMCYFLFKALIGNDLTKSFKLKHPSEKNGITTNQLKIWCDVEYDKNNP
jgi:hypothetical protein